MNYSEFDRRNFLKMLGGSAVAAMLPVSECVASVAKPPNILLIAADDLGYEKLGCYGGLNTSTPVLDKMAKEGTRFVRAYTSPVCTPSRMSLYTGTYTPRHKFTDVLPIHLGSKDAVDFQKWPTYAQALREAGYTTSVTGKWQLAGLEFHPEHCRLAGFDSWCVWQIWSNNAKTIRYWNPTLNQDGAIRTDLEKRFGPDVLTEYVIDQMRSAKEVNKPFCIHHNMMLPHVPIVQTPHDLELNRPGSLDNMISYMDAQIGRLLAALNELDIADNTIVLFVGDNGTQTKSVRMTTAGKVTGGKRDLNDGGTHVPLITYSPGRVPAGNIAHDLVDMADFFPTICELAGAKLPENKAIDGISFVDPLTGKGPSQRQWVTAGIYDDLFVFDGEWRLHNIDNKLFDCRDLPYEKLADLSSDAAKAAKARLLPILNNLRNL